MLHFCALCKNESRVLSLKVAAGALRVAPKDLVLRRRASKSSFGDTTFGGFLPIRARSSSCFQWLWTKQVVPLERFSSKKEYSFLCFFPNGFGKVRSSSCFEEFLGFPIQARSIPCSAPQPLLRRSESFGGFLGFLIRARSFSRSAPQERAPSPTELFEALLRRTTSFGVKKDHNLRRSEYWNVF